MVAKLYRYGQNSYVFADDTLIQHGKGDWVASEILEKEDLLALISGATQIFAADTTC